MRGRWAAAGLWTDDCFPLPDLERTLFNPPWFVWVGEGSGFGVFGVGIVVRRWVGGLVWLLWRWVIGERLRGGSQGVGKGADLRRTLADSVEKGGTKTRQIESKTLGSNFSISPTCLL